MQRTVITILGTLAVSAVAVLGGAYAFVVSGIYDVSATTPDSPLVSWATHQTMEHSVARRLGANVVPTGLDAPERIASGGRMFLANCSVCHGGPGLEPTSISRGLNPQPPNLFEATREPDPAENFQFIKHGVKMTGMPAFGPTKSDTELWSLVAFLNVAPGLSAADFARISGRQPAADAASPWAPVLPAANAPAVKG
jgi:mono/diheme cytochrome c family protein